MRLRRDTIRVEEPAVGIGLPLAEFPPAGGLLLVQQDGHPGSRLTAAALTRKTTVVNQGSAWRTSLEWNASAKPPIREPRVKPTLSAEYM